MSLSDLINQVSKRNHESITARREERERILREKREKDAVKMAVNKLKAIASGATKADFDVCTKTILEASKSSAGLQIALEFLRKNPWKISFQGIESLVKTAGEKGEEVVRVFFGRLFGANGEPCWKYFGDLQYEGKAFYSAILSLFISLEAMEASPEEMRNMASNLLDSYPRKIYKGDYRLRKLVETIEETGQLPHKPGGNNQPFPKACYASREKGDDPGEATPEEIEEYMRQASAPTFSIGEVTPRRNGNKNNKKLREVRGEELATA